MFYSNQTVETFQEMKEKTFERFEQSYKRVAMKEIKLDITTVCYISSLSETMKILFDKSQNVIVTNSIFSHDLTEIELLKNELKKENE